MRRQGLPLRCTWIEQPYGEEEITLLEEEVIPAIQQCLVRIDELDQRMLAQQELLQRCQLKAGRELLLGKIAQAVSPKFIWFIRTGIWLTVAPRY